MGNEAKATYKKIRLWVSFHYFTNNKTDNRNIIKEQPWSYIHKTTADSKKKIGSTLKI